METIYDLRQKEAVAVLTVYDLLAEYDNREILRDAQRRIDQGFTNFVIDLSKVPYMNSVGLNFLITLQARCTDQGGRLVVAHASPKVVQLLEMTKLLPLFHLSDSVANAIQTLEARN
jgi:anti-sigma B factor antagonist